MSPEKKIRVLVVEDQSKILKHQLKVLKQYSDRIDIVGSAMSGEDGVKEALRLVPDVILLDLGLPRMDGIEVTRQVKAQLKSTEILIFTIFEEEGKVIEAVRAGASGYLVKPAEADKIVEAIEEVHGGGAVIQPTLARSLLRVFREPPPSPAAPPAPRQPPEMELAAGFRALTEREVEILQLIAKGLSNSEAAKILGLSKATIRTHLEHIYAKLDVTNRVEAVTEGIRQGLIEV